MAQTVKVKSSLLITDRVYASGLLDPIAVQPGTSFHQVSADPQSRRGNSTATSTPTGQHEEQQTVGCLIGVVAGCDRCCGDLG